MFFPRLKPKLLFSLLFSSVMSFCAVAQTWDPDVATINGEKIKLSSISKGDEQQIYKAEMELYNLRVDDIRNMLISRFIELDPKSKGLTENEYVKQFIADPKPVVEAEIQLFIKQSQIPQDKINTNLKERVRRYLLGQQIAVQIEAWYQIQSNKHQAKINLEKPEEPRYQVDISDSPFRGGENASVTIVEFSDFQCPYCVQANDTLAELIEAYGDKIKVVYKHYPLSGIHPAAEKAAEASICAQQQGNAKFWQLHDKIFANYRNLSLGVIKDMAKEIGLNQASFNQCLQSGQFASRVDREREQGLLIGVQSTPAFLINGRFIKGAQPFDVFKTMIDEELQSTQ